MSEIKDGGPVFPGKASINRSTGELRPRQFGNDDFETLGMSLRDYFAAHAPDAPDDFEWADGETDSWQRRSRWSFCYADAMLSARGAA